VKPALALLRPKQWIKNLLVFGALIFTGRGAETEAIAATLYAFGALCLAAGAVYAVNDALDADKDRAHPVKRRRPIAAGKLTKNQGFAIGAFALVGGLALAWLAGPLVLGGVAVYLVMQAFYQARAKRVPLLDVFIIAFGFVLRSAIGALAIQAPISGWLLFCTGCLALLLGFGKRRSELALMGAEAAQTRPALGGYSRQSLDSLLLFSAACAAMGYGVYAIESPTAEAHPALILTAAPVFTGIVRYLFLALGQDEGGEPESLIMKDPWLIGSVLAFLGLAVYAMAGGSLPYVGR
jgi:4-hydroxybenzoate polyprenyltransferase